MSLPASYSNPAPAFSPLDLNYSICALAFLSGLDRLWLCFDFHPFSLEKGCCDIVGCVLFKKIYASFWGVYEPF